MDPDDAEVTDVVLHTTIILCFFVIKHSLAYKRSAGITQPM